MCISNAACDDGDPCNGTETCTPPDIIRFCRCDPTPPCEDFDPCTRDVCTSTPRGVTCDHQSGGCDDGVFCNGAEPCHPLGGACLDLPPPCAAPLLCDEGNDRCVDCLGDGDCDDNFPCTTGVCDSATGLCRHQYCADQFCDGRTICSSTAGCLTGVAPCATLETCDEGTNQCGDCMVDADCDDGAPDTVDECYVDWRACRSRPAPLAFESPTDGTVFHVGKLVDVRGVGGPRGLDLALVLDESGSIDAAEWTQLKTFAINVVNRLPYRLDGTRARVGITTFATGSRRILNMNSSQTTITSMLNAIVQFDGATCIGCGIDDASDNLLRNGRVGAIQLMIVLTDGMNNQPGPDPELHLTGALQSAAFRRQFIFAIGVGNSVSVSQIDQIGSDIPGVQTAFLVSDFSVIETFWNVLLEEFAGPGEGNNYISVDLTLPDGTEAPAVADLGGDFGFPNWSIVPGENRFFARVGTFDGEQTDSLTLIGVYPCSNRCGDVNGDGAADLRDLAVFQNCFGGPSYSSASCACSDLNGSVGVDLTDFAPLPNLLGHSSVDQPPDCIQP